MFKSIMMPVDMAHLETQRRALQCAADLGTEHGSGVCYVGVTTGTPNAMGHTPAEFEKLLVAFAAEQGAKHGLKASHKVMIAHDPVTDIDDTLMKAVKETGADLVVMATHKPGIGDYIWPSNGGKLAAHSEASVFLVRG